MKNPHEKYNGFENFETWLVHLNLSNDRRFYLLYEGVQSPKELKELWNKAKESFCLKVNQKLVNWEEIFKFTYEENHANNQGVSK